MMCVGHDSQTPIDADPKPMRDVIFLVHRIPFPPDKGDKIRSFHLLKGLSQHYRVHLGAFIDHSEDRQYQDEVAQLCANTCFVDLDPRLARFRGVAGLLSREPLTFAYYRSRRLARWVKQVSTRHDVCALIAFSGCMAQYGKPSFGARRILDLVDVDSEKWRQYSAMSHGLLRWAYGREYRLLHQAEIAMAREFDYTVLVSDSEADLLRSRMGSDACRVKAIGNGVDTGFFDPSRDYPNPYAPSGAPVAVFTGAMDYRANVDAVQWFARAVWPHIRVQCPAAQFWIVGARPTIAVRNLDTLNGVVVTGRVEDVRPYLRYAQVGVAPLRVGRGVQNKVLEALAMTLPVVATPQAWEGIDPVPADCGVSTPDSDEMARAVSKYLQARQSAAVGRRFVAEHHDWGQAVERLRALVDSDTGRMVRPWRMAG